MQEGYARQIFSSERSGSTKKTRYSAIIVDDGKGGVSVVWFGKGFLFSWLRCTGGDEERKVVIVQFMEVTASYDISKENFGCNCLRKNTSEEKTHKVCREELDDGRMDVGELYGAESSSSKMGSMHITRPNPALHAFSRELP